GWDGALDGGPGQVDPASDEAALAEQPQTARLPGAREERPAGHGSRYGDRTTAAFSPAPTLAKADDAITDGAEHGTAAGAVPGLRADDALLEAGRDTEPNPEPTA